MPSTTRKPPRGRPRREVADDAVFAAVERLLGEGASYTELGVGQIADAAGIGRSTFYVHFADKTDLLVRLIRANTAELFAVAETWLDTRRGDGFARLEEALLEVTRQRRTHRDAMNALTEVAAYDREVGAFWRARIDAFTERLAKRLAAEKRRGDTAPDLDPKPTAAFLVWAVERTLEQHTLAGSPRGDAKLVRAMARSAWLTMYGSADDLPR